MLRAHEVSDHTIPDDGIPRFRFDSPELRAFWVKHCDRAGRWVDPVEYYVIHPSLSGGPTLVVRSVASVGHRAAHVAEEFYLPR